MQPNDDYYSRLEHLKLIQGIIARMGQNSFALKCWSVTLAAALAALAVNAHRRAYAALAFFPALVFWGLDAYYLWQERRFRDAYNIVCDGQRTSYSLAPPALTRCAQFVSWLKTTGRPTVAALHMAIIIVIAAVIVSLSRR